MTRLLTASIRDQLIRNGKVSVQSTVTGRQAPDFVPIVRLFTPDASCTWLLTEISPSDPDTAFGLCDVGAGFPELGPVRLSELEAVRGPLGLRVERDLHFRPRKTISAYAEEARLAERGPVSATPGSRRL